MELSEKIFQKLRIMKKTRRPLSFRSLYAMGRQRFKQITSFDCDHCSPLHVRTQNLTNNYWTNYNTISTLQPCLCEYLSLLRRVKKTLKKGKLELRLKWKGNTLAYELLRHSSKGIGTDKGMRCDKTELLVI